MSRPHRNRLCGGLLLAALALAAPGSVAAHADPAGDPQAQAAGLRVRVAALQLQAEQATEKYDAAEVELGAAVTAHLSAERDLAAAQATAGASDDQAGARIRALYMAGGSAGLYATVLDSGNLSDALTRLHQVTSVVEGDTRAVRRAGSSIAARRTAEQRLATAAQASTALQAAVAAQADAVRGLLAEADSLLAAADSRVRALAEQQQRDAETAAAARAAALLAAARANPDGPAGTLAGGPADLLPAGAPASARAAAALAFAAAQVGKPYVWGATGLDSYDCSGLTGRAYAAAGVHLPRTASQQWSSGPHVALASLQPGDLMFWASDLSDPATIHHVAMYWGNGQMLAAPHTGAQVRIQPIYLDGYLGAVRPAG